MSFPEHRFNGAPKLFQMQSILCVSCVYYLMYTSSTCVQRFFPAFERAVLKVYSSTCHERTPSGPGKSVRTLQVAARHRDGWAGGGRNFFYTLVPGSGNFQLSRLVGLGYGLGFWVVFTILVSLTLTLTLITTLTVILP